MGKPVLAEYLLRLATDKAELDKFRSFKDEAGRRAYLTKEIGLSSEQAEAVSSDDSHKIVQAVVKELHEHRSTEKSFYGTPLAIVTPLGSYGNTQQIQRVTDLE